MKRTVCVYCASGVGLDRVFYAQGEELGWGLARRGWDLVYGGGRSGVMGSVA